MKRCPECRRSYTDETLNFCLDDGSALLDGPASMDEPATAILPSAGTSAERPTELMGGFEQSNESAGLKDSLNTSGVPRFSTKYWAVGGIALLVIGALFVVYWPRGKDDREIRTLQIERLTTSGRSTSAAISPDGKYVIYGTDEGGKDSLWLRQVTTSSNVQIFPASEDVFYWGLTFTPDSDYVNFVKAELEKNVSWSLSQMPVLGGSQKEILKGVEGPVSYSPDGKQFAFVRD
jgi:WD40 repeat protein